MAKLVFATFRNDKKDLFSRSNMELLNKRLEPDNILYSSPHIIASKNQIIAIFNPNDSLKIHQTSVCLGNMINPDNQWWLPKNELPDGTFALFRSNEKYVEIISDFIASRSIWYYFDENVFISSTSQRAIIFFLKSFQFNSKIISWMLATGTLGYGYSWDTRIKILPGNSSLLLNKSEWLIKINNIQYQFSPVQKSAAEHEQDLTKALYDSFSSLDLSYDKWILPLSGGYDSRAILCMLKYIDNLKCVTWGLKNSQFQKKNDAYIAKKLADYFGKKHTYYITNVSEEPIDKIFKRYLICGEGRTDNISAYMDGFQIWKQLFQESIQGIIRGDEGFGCMRVSSELDVRLNMKFPLLSDYANLKSLIEVGIHEYETPDILKRKHGETIEIWRDRVYYQYEIPYVFAALNDLKLSFVEVVNPLLSRRILKVVETIPDKLRTNKKLFRMIVNKMSPDIGYAKHIAIDNPENILKDTQVYSFLKEELGTAEARSVLPVEYLNEVNKQMELNMTRGFIQRQSVKNSLKQYLPANIKSILKLTIVKPQLDYNMLAFRSYIIVAMSKLLREDANIL